MLKQSNTPVEKSKQENRLAEIFQNNLTELALARYDSQSDKIVQCHQFVHCRDFILDAFVSLEDNIDVRIYGFRYDKDCPKPDAVNTSFLLKLQPGALKNFQENLPILKSIENFLNWNVTFGDIVDYPELHAGETVVWVFGDPRWQATAVSLSLYTFLLKCLTYPIKNKDKWMEEIKNAGTTESKYIDEEHLRLLLVNLGEIICKYRNFSGFSDQKTKDLWALHDGSGFVSIKKALRGDPYYQTHALYNYRPGDTCTASPVTKN